MVSNKSARSDLWHQQGIFLHRAAARWIFPSPSRSAGCESLRPEARLAAGDVFDHVQSHFGRLARFDLQLVVFATWRHWVAAVWLTEKPFVLKQKHFYLIKSLVSILAGHNYDLQCWEYWVFSSFSGKKKKKNPTQSQHLCGRQCQIFAGYSFTFESLNKCDKNVKCSDVTAQIRSGITGKRIKEAVLTAHLDGFE